MTRSLAHRGPDSEGQWSDGTVAMGHTRLAIIDLREEANQPMISRCGRYVLTYNGEIYNYQALRRQLQSEGHEVRTDSDTEVLLEAVAAWGLQPAVRRFRGMFVFGIWDRQSRQLHIARDRLGIKPLYYGRIGSHFVFGSELKAFRLHPGWQGEIDPVAAALFLQNSYIPCPETIFKGCSKLPPGTALTISVDSTMDAPEPVRYWNLPGAPEALECSADEAVANLRNEIEEAVRLRMMSDVPLGAFLSGGIDSSLIVALMQRFSSDPVRTFTIGFSEADFDEGREARQVAAYLQTDHTELYVTPAEALAVVPELPRIYDEPFGDVSQIPTYLLSQLARRDVTVAISGDGGDEVFGGYNRYTVAARWWCRTNGWPGPVKAAMASLMTSVSPDRWDQVLRTTRRLSEGRLVSTLGEKIHKAARVLAASNPGDLYRVLAAQWDFSTALLKAEPDPPLLELDGFPGDSRDLVRTLQRWDMQRYLPDDILVKVDRASMAVSLEVRVPLLDHKVLEAAWRLPTSAHVSGGVGKRLLRDFLDAEVPPPLKQRPKKGFGVPIGEWMRDPLRDWTESHLRPQRIEELGLNPDPIRQSWQAHVEGRQNNQYGLWNVAMLSAWLETEQAPRIPAVSEPARIGQPIR